MQTPRQMVRGSLYTSFLGSALLALPLPSMFAYQVYLPVPHLPTYLLPTPHPPTRLLLPFSPFRKPENLTSSHRLGPAAPPPPPDPEPNAVPPTPSPRAPPPPRLPLRSPPAQVSPDTVGPCLPLAGGAEKRLGSFSASPGNYINEFQRLAQARDLTWHHLPVVQTTTLTPEERAHSGSGAGTRRPGPSPGLAVPVGAPGGSRRQILAVDPSGGSRMGLPGRPGGPRTPDRMVQCLLAGMRAASNKVVNYDKLREIVENPDENPPVFLNRLTEALTQ